MFDIYFVVISRCHYAVPIVDTNRAHDSVAIYKLCLDHPTDLSSTK